MAKKLSGVDRRKARVRRAIKNRANGRPRLSVFRSEKNIYVQIIDDANGVTLAAASTLDKDIKKSNKNGATQDAAIAAGKLIAQRAKEAKIADVVFDRGPYIFHGRVKALADAARQAGLSF